MTTTLFSRQQLQSLATQIDNKFDSSKDFDLHLCVRGDVVHCEVTWPKTYLEEVVVEQETVDRGGVIQKRTLRHSDVCYPEQVKPEEIKENKRRNGRRT